MERFARCFGSVGRCQSRPQFPRRNTIPFTDFFTSTEPKAPVQTKLALLTNPYTASTLRRQKATSVSPVFVFRGRCVSKLSVKKLQTGGRNNTGRVTVRSRGGGRRQRLRLVDYKRGRKDIWATVLRLEHDPSRRAFLALIQYDDGVLSYVLATECVGPGSRILASEHADILPGNCLPLKTIPPSTIVHSVELRAGAGAQLVRAAGLCATVLESSRGYTSLQLPSGEIRKVPDDCWAVIGQVSEGRGQKKLTKAGERRWRGRRPHVRGCAMQKHRHPHGGERTGSATKSKPPKNIWNKPAQHFKTRSASKFSSRLIVRRRVPTPSAGAAVARKKTTHVY